MSRSKKKGLITLLFMLILTKPIYAQNDSIQDKISLAYMNLETASSNGADVSEPVALFNEVIDSVKKGDYQENTINAKLDIIIITSERINQEALVESRNEIILRVSILSLIMLVELLVWRYLPRLYWKNWIDKHGDWTIDETG